VPLPAFTRHERLAARDDLLRAERRRLTSRSRLPTGREDGSRCGRTSSASCPDDWLVGRSQPRTVAKCRQLTAARSQHCGSTWRPRSHSRYGRDAQLRPDRRRAPPPTESDGRSRRRPLPMRSGPPDCGIPTTEGSRSEPIDSTPSVSPPREEPQRFDRGCTPRAYARPGSSPAATPVDGAAVSPYAAVRELSAPRLQIDRSSHHLRTTAISGVMQAPGTGTADECFSRPRVARPPSAWRPTETPPLTGGSCGRAGEQAEQVCERDCRARRRLVRQGAIRTIG
jgi:hypothetical protein